MVGQPCLGTACAGGRLGAESFGWLGVCHAGLCSLDWGWTGAAFFQGIYVTRVSEGGPAEIAGLQIGDKIMQVNGWDMTMVTHDQARKRLTKRSEEVVRLLVTRQSLQKAVQQSMLS